MSSNVAYVANVPARMCRILRALCNFAAQMNVINFHWVLARARQTLDAPIRNSHHHTTTIHLWWAHGRESTLLYSTQF